MSSEYKQIYFSHFLSPSQYYIYRRGTKCQRKVSFFQYRAALILIHSRNYPRSTNTPPAFTFYHQLGEHFGLWVFSQTLKAINLICPVLASSILTLSLPWRRDLIIAELKTSTEAIVLSV